MGKNTFDPLLLASRSSRFPAFLPSRPRLLSFQLEKMFSVQRIPLMMVFLVLLQIAQASSGWIECKDPTSGRTYYHNEITKVSTFVKPKVQPRLADHLTNVKKSKFTVHDAVRVKFKVHDVVRVSI